MMKFEVNFEYRREAYESTPARNGKIDEKFAFFQGLSRLATTARTADASKEATLGLGDSQSIREKPLL
jgi:hypothetical protein